MLRMLSVVSLAIILFGCSQSGEDPGAAEKGHPWKTQTDALKAAQDVEGVMLEGAERRGRALEEESR